jgi:hypothetical protein
MQKDPLNAQAGLKDKAAQAAQQVIDLVCMSWRESAEQYGTSVPTVSLSLACYLLHGHPPRSEMGFYGRLQLLSPHLQTWLARRLCDALQRKIHLNLLHDGTAAALPYAGSPNTAVILLGTALGVGFPPPSAQGLGEELARLTDPIIS